MLKRITDIMKNFYHHSIPFVRVDMHDLEKEQRDEMASFGLSEGYGQLGLEFRFEAFNASGQMVCLGKIDHIPGKQVTVRRIETELEYRHQGYGTSAVIEISKYFGGLPIVPMDERGDGIHFWAALRKRSETADIIKEQISLTEASQLLKHVEASLRLKM